MSEAKIALTAEDLTKPAVESAKAGLRGLGTTAVAVSGQTQQALRMLPAQITDIVTGLASGQAPMTVLIQQGGQLKDMFGGVGAAARAVTGYIAGLINPLTLAALGVGGLALAWHEGTKEAEQYTRAIILSGNAAGTTSAQLAVMAERISAITGTTGAAADALAQLVATGQIRNEDLKRYAELVVRLDRVGIAAKDTVADLAALGKDPVAASQRLDAAMNFLDASTQRQIKSLQEQGRTEEAAEVAQKAYAAAWEQRYGKLEENLGTLSKAWRAVADEAIGAWDAMKGIGRPDSVETQLKNVREQLAKARALQPQFPYEYGPEVARLVEQERRLTEQTQATVAAQEASAKADAKRADQKKALADFDQLVERTRSPRERMRLEQERARNLGAAAGASQEEIDKVVGNIGYEETRRGIETQIQRLKTAAEVLDVRTQAAIAVIQSERAFGNINERGLVEQTAKAEIDALERKRELLEREIALKAKERDSEKEVAALRGQEAVLSEQITARRLKAGLDLLILDQQREKAIRAVISAEYDEAQLDRAKAIIEQDKAIQGAIGAQNAWKRSLQEGNEQIDFEASLLGKTTEEQTRLNEQRRIELTLRERKRQIDALPSEVDASTRNMLNDDAEAAAARALAKVDTKIYIDKWKSVNGQVADGLYDVLTGRGKDAADRLKKIFGDMVLRPILQPIANSITNAIMGGIGGVAGGAGAGAGAAGALGSIGNIAGLGSLAGMGSAIGTAFTAGSTSVGVMAGSIAGGGGLMGGAAAALGAVPVAGWVALGAMALGSILSKSGGGPKAESGFGSGVPLRGDPSAARTTVEAIQQQYASIIGNIGGTAGKLDLGVFSAADPQGTALTQLALNANLNGQSIYSRAARTGGIENVGRSESDLQAAVAEDSTRAIFAAIKATEGLSDSMRAILSTTDAYSSSLEQVNATLQRAVTAETQRKTLEETLFQLTHTEQENLQHQREAELAALDETNRALARRIYGLQDEKKAEEQAAAAAQKAQEVLDGVRKRIADSTSAAMQQLIGVTRDVADYLAKLDGTGAGMLSPDQQVANSRTQFDRQLQLARSGDLNALQGLTRSADQYIQAQTAYTATGRPTQDAISYVRQSLAGLDYGSLQGVLQMRNIRGAEDPAGDLSATLNQILSLLAAYAPRALANGAEVARSLGDAGTQALLSRVAVPS